MFCDKISAAGYKAGVYSSASWFDEYITLSGNYEKWIAHWGGDDGTWSVDLSGQCAIHQYTSKPLDQDVFYIDPSIWY
jgi:GH25 family lysozyme M1 (1,4-beta-N-acetylmuramidase)